MENYRIGIITMPMVKAGVIPLSNLISIVYPTSKNIFLITGDEGYDFFRKDKRIKIFRLSPKNSTFFIKRIFNYISVQLEISWYIFKTRREIDFFIFLFGGDALLLPMLTAHLFRKKVLLMFAASSTKIHTSRNDPLVLGLKILQFMTCTFADIIIVYSKRIIDDYSLNRWTPKIMIARHHYVDFDLFKIKKDYHSRDCIVGYIGRFNEEKGILHLLHAVPECVFKKQNIKFIFIGDGALRKTIEQYILDNNLSDKIILHGWVSHDILADYLNQMKLLVIPSDTEGLPNIMLEAMACGTPVLATSVGAIPTIILNGETGFILENNSPQCITSNIIKILDDENSFEVIKNAYQLIQIDFKLEKRIEEFKVIFDAIL
jgi:glycosyltransferase involved in cell wall biosynthesis